MALGTSVSKSLTDKMDQGPVIKMSVSSLTLVCSCKKRTLGSVCSRHLLGGGLGGTAAEHKTYGDKDSEAKCRS